MTISERIFELIRERGYSQKEFSKKTGIAESTISDWKKKGTNPVSDKILIICEVLEVSPYYLLSGVENNDKRSREGRAPAAKSAPEKKPEVKKSEPAETGAKKAEDKKEAAKAAEKKAPDKKAAGKKSKEVKPAADKTADDMDVRLPNIATVAKDDDDYHIRPIDGDDKKADKKDKDKKKKKDKDKDKKKKKDKDKKKKKGYLITY